MDFEALRKTVQTAKAKNPFLFELEHDRTPTAEETMAFQRQHQIVLPEKYIQLLLSFGGGCFGYTSIYSLDSVVNKYGAKSQYSFLLRIIISHFY